MALNNFTYREPNASLRYFPTSTKSPFIDTLSTKRQQENNDYKYALSLAAGDINSKNITLEQENVIRAQQKSILDFWNLKKDSNKNTQSINDGNVFKQTDSSIISTHSIHQTEDVKQTISSLAAEEKDSAISSGSKSSLVGNINRVDSTDGSESYFNEWLEKMRNPKEFGDHVTLQAAANLFNVNIHVIRSIGKNNFVIPNSNFHQEKPKDIYLYYIPDIHYQQYNPYENKQIERGGEGACQFASLASELYRLGLRADIIFGHDGTVDKNSSDSIRKDIIDEIEKNQGHYFDSIVPVPDE